MCNHAHQVFLQQRLVCVCVCVVEACIHECCSFIFKSHSQSSLVSPAFVKAEQGVSATKVSCPISLPLWRLMAGLDTVEDRMDS